MAHAIAVSWPTRDRVTVIGGHDERQTIPAIGEMDLIVVDDIDDADTGRWQRRLVDHVRSGCRVVLSPSGTPARPPGSARFVELPALSRRAGDIPALVAEWERRQRPAARVEPTVVAELTKHSWDAENVRQLFDALSFARQRSDGRPITPTTLDTALTRTAHRRLNHLEQVERDAIAELLRASGGRRSEVATELGISRATLYRKLSALGLA